MTEYSEELRHSKAWQADPEGERKKLVDSWLKTYGEDGHIKLYKAVGCEKCGKTGYKGRVGLVLVADDGVKKTHSGARTRVRVVCVCGRGWHANLKNGRLGEDHDGADGLEDGAAGLYQIADGICDKNVKTKYIAPKIALTSSISVEIAVALWKVDA
ncbi:hypothetical protein [Candidatus Aalborgicola defluviihabitans]|uniref:hypothetical protein n=1 Tax=Candidatus Aalborgicola defluviihabitans TaxID=3386187 RepID=UPI001D64B4D1|nr:hypothetical protein [Burkholderiales bacterium]